MVPLVLGLTAALGAQTVETMPNPLPATYRGNVFPFGSTSANAQHVQFIYDGSQISASYRLVVVWGHLHGDAGAALLDLLH